jgi:hypothetical protein
VRADLVGTAVLSKAARSVLPVRDFALIPLDSPGVLVVHYGVVLRKKEFC